MMGHGRQLLIEKEALHQALSVLGVS